MGGRCRIPQARRRGRVWLGAMPKRSPGRAYAHQRPSHAQPSVDRGTQMRHELPGHDSSAIVRQKALVNSRPTTVMYGGPCARWAVGTPGACPPQAARCTPRHTCSRLNGHRGPPPRPWTDWTDGPIVGETFQKTAGVQPPKSPGNRRFVLHSLHIWDSHVSQNGWAVCVDTSGGLMHAWGWHVEAPERGLIGSGKTAVPPCDATTHRDPFAWSGSQFLHSLRACALARAGVRA